MEDHNRKAKINQISSQGEQVCYLGDMEVSDTAVESALSTSVANKWSI